MFPCVVLFELMRCTLAGYALDREFTIAEWPAKYRTARKALFKMWDDETHRVNYLPARNHRNELLRPIHYDTRLPNALVEMHFSMKHLGVAEGPDGRPSHNMFFLDILEIHILQNSFSNPDIGKKRVVSRDTSFPVSPRKKSKVY